MQVLPRPSMGTVTARVTGRDLADAARYISPGITAPGGGKVLIVAGDGELTFTARAGQELYQYAVRGDSFGDGAVAVVDARAFETAVMRGAKPSCRQKIRLDVTDWGGAELRFPRGTARLPAAGQADIEYFKVMHLWPSPGHWTGAADDAAFSFPGALGLTALHALQPGDPGPWPLTGVHVTAVPGGLAFTAADGRDRACTARVDVRRDGPAGPGGDVILDAAPMLWWAEETSSAGPALIAFPHDGEPWAWLDDGAHCRVAAAPVLCSYPETGGWFTPRSGCAALAALPAGTLRQHLICVLGTGTPDIRLSTGPGGATVTACTDSTDRPVTGGRPLDIPGTVTGENPAVRLDAGHLYEMIFYAADDETVTLGFPPLPAGGTAGSGFAVQVYGTHFSGFIAARPGSDLRPGITAENA